MITMPLWLFLLSIVSSIIVFPSVIALLKRLKFGQYIQEDVLKHAQKAQTPTSAGVVLISLLSVMCFCAGALRSYEAVLVMAVFVSFMLIGFVDDLAKLLYQGNHFGLSARMKLLLQAMLAVLVVCCLGYLHPHTFADVPIPLGNARQWVLHLGWWYYPFAVFAMLGATNAFNLTDGLDGLASGLTIVVCAGLLYLLHVGTFDELSMLVLQDLASILLVLAGLLTGFLVFNGFPAAIFLGDSGSLSLGAGLMTIALLLHVELVFACMAGMFIIETLSVIAQVLYFRYTGGKRLLRMAPLHHHYELAGFAEPKIVLCFWVAGLIFLLISICFLV